MDAPYDDVYDAIVAHLGQWDSTLAPIYFENDGDGEPAGAGYWILAVLDTSLYAQETIGGGQDPGDNRWDEAGTLWLHVFSPRGVGSREARRLAKALANLFRGVRLLDDQLEFLDADMGAGDPARENGNYYLLSVSIDWRRIDAH